MTCASCVGVIERSLGAKDGVIAVSVGLVTKRCRVEFHRDKIGVRDLIGVIEVSTLYQLGDAGHSTSRKVDGAPFAHVDVILDFRFIHR